jgi:cation:H+ antiporter
LLFAWLQFFICLALIAYAGARLTRYGDAIADKTGLGGSWIGLILMATVTSLPELVSGVTAVAVVDVPEIAIGDVLGSCLFNLLIIVVLDFLYREESVYRRASQGHILSAGFGVLMIGNVGFSIMLGDQLNAFAIGHVGIYVPVILMMYLVAVRSVFRYESQQVKAFSESEPDRYPGLTLRQAWLRYAGAALVVVGAAIWLRHVAEQLAALMGWRHSFVGTLFVALATSVPELIVTISALRIGAVDMAIANLFGSNLFNIFVVAVDDIFYTEGPLLAHVSEVHALSAFSAIMMTGVAVIGLLYRPRGRVFRTIGWTSIALFLVYVLNVFVLYLY